MKILEKLDGITNKLNKLEKEQKSYNPITYKKVSYTLTNLLSRGILFFVFFILFFELFKNLVDILATIQKIIYNLVSNLIGNHTGDVFMLQVVNLCFLFFLIIVILFIISILVFIFGGDFSFFVKTSKKVFVLFLVILFFLTGVHTFITGEIYSVNSEELQFNLKEGSTGFVGMIKDIACYMSVDCIRESQKRDESQTIKQGEYKVEIDFPTYFNNRINWQDEDIDVNFNIKVKADGSYPIVINSYTCQFGTKEKVLGTSIYSKKLELLKEEKIDKSIKTQGEYLTVYGSCKIPADKINKNKEISDYVLDIDLDISSKTNCQYPFYILDYENTLQKYGINKEGKQDDMITYSLLNQQNILSKEFSVTSANFLCSNNIFKINHPKLEQPFFSGANLDYYKNIFFDINIEQNNLNSIGKSQTAQIYKVNIPDSLTLDTQKTKDLISETDGFILKNPNFYDNKLSFAMFFNDLKGIDKTKSIEYIEFFLEGSFKYSSSKQILIRNLNYKQNSQEENLQKEQNSNNEERSDTSTTQNNNDKERQISVYTASEYEGDDKTMTRIELESFCSTHKDSEEDINCQEANDSNLVEFYKKKKNEDENSYTSPR